MRRPKEITLDKKIDSIEDFMFNLTDSQLSYFSQKLHNLLNNQEAAKGGKAANAERQVTDVGMVCRPEHKPPRKSLKPIGKVGLELLRGERSKEVKE